MFDGYWRDITSAPKDGTPVLLFARLDSAEASTRVVGAYHDSLGWFAQSYSHQKIAQVVPSHWMELPPFPGTPPASAQDDAKDEQQAFEAWAKSKKMPLARIGEQYDDFWVDHAWNGWQARASVAAPAAGDAPDSLVNKLAGMAYQYAVTLDQATRDADNDELEAIARRITGKLRDDIRAALAASQQQEG